MLAEGHRKAAEDIEVAIKVLQPHTDATRVIIESAWGAGFHWVAFGRETKYHNHQNNHTRLGRFLRDRGEKDIAEAWETLDRARQGGWYGGELDPTEIRMPLALLEKIRLWATQ